MPNAQRPMPNRDNGGDLRSVCGIRHSSAFGIRHSSLTGERGFTFVELLVVTTILLILASAVLPLAKVSIQRQREAELRRNLREMRTAIDKFKDDADAQR